MGRLIVAGLLSAVACGCGSSPAEPTRNALTINATQPASGATVIVPPQFVFFNPGGVVIPPGSGLLSVNVTLSAGFDIPWAQLTGGTTDQYCGQNANDSPTWQFLAPGWQTTVNVTGFRVYQLPCDVTGFRAMFHMRNNGLAIPPNASETIAEATVATTLHVRR